MNQQKYWDEMAKFGASASVIDPSDTKGYKNQYIVGLRNTAILNSLKTLTPPKAHVLDFGCGSGNLSELLSQQGYKVSGVDISTKLLEFSRERQGINTWDVHHYDGKTLPLKNESIDVIVTYVVLNHILDDIQFKTTIDELCRVLKPNGKIIAIEQVSRHVTTSSDGSKKQRKRSYFINSFQQSGLEVVSHKTVRRGHFPLLYAIRYGLIPRSFFKSIATIESLIGNYIKEPFFDYADVAFILNKNKKLDI